MATEPPVKMAVAFIDGQNLFHSAKEAFGYSFPNYDPKVLSERVCLLNGWQLAGVHFYSGVPDATVSPDWHHFWTRKLAVMGSRGVHSFTRPLRYRHETVILSDGTKAPVLVGREKGVDVRIALDIVRMAREKQFDVALVLSQDQDLSEVADEVRKISIQQGRWIKMACAFPHSPACSNARGINGTQWIKMDRALYDQCLDKNDYRMKTK